MAQGYWQIAAGDEKRDYDYGELFLKYGMAFIGGEPREAERMKNVKVGETFVLKRGKTAIRAVGKVTRDADGDKDWLKDIDGWNLSYYKYVEWRVSRDDKEDVTEPVSRKLTIARLTRLNDEDLRQRADRIWCTGKPCDPCEEPKPTNPVTDEELLSFLIEQGFPPSSAEESIRTIAKARLLANYYYEYKPQKHIREHETRTFLVVPLLLALGWSEPQLKIEQPCGEGRRIDVACFRPIYKGSHEGCVSVIETKGVSIGLGKKAYKQALEYAKKSPNCRTIVLTNGNCYKVVAKGERDDRFPESPESPTAYLNLRDPRQRYPLDPENVDGAFGAIKCLLPN